MTHTAQRSQGKLVHTLNRVLGTALLAVLIGEPVAAIPALAQSGAAATAATLSGTVSNGSGGGVAGATLTLSGPVSATATSDASGHYTFNVPPGLYRIVVRAAGYSESSDDNVTVTSQGSTLDVRVVAPTLSSLQTIGTVRTTGRGPAFNTGPAAESVVTAQQFEDQGDISVRTLLDETPGIVISQSNGSSNGGVRGSISAPNIRGGLSYETASMIDGHPVSGGKYGQYVTTFLNRQIFQSVEVEKGPGSMPQVIDRAVNGTVNFRTWDPTSSLAGNFTYGLDGFGGDYSNVRVSDTVLKGKLGFVIDFATEGTPGPGGNTNPRTFVGAFSSSQVTYTDSHGVPVTISPETPVRAPGATANTSLASNTIGCCLNMPTYFSNRSELVKLRFNLSDATTFTASMIASQAIASQNGNNQNLYNVAFNPAVPNASIPSGTVNAFFPFADNFAQDYEFNSEPIYTGELRTTLKNDTVLARFYSASISRNQTNGDQSNANFSLPVQLYGTTAAGLPLTGTDPYGQSYIANITSPLFQSREQDNLIGYSLEYDKQFGTSGNYLTFSADENYAWTHVYTPGMPDTSSNTNIPDGSAQNTATYRLLYTGAITPKLSVEGGYWLSRFDTHFPFFPTANTFQFGDIINWHGDERIAFTYRPARNTSVRLSAGTSVAAPYLGILSGSAGAPTLCTSSTCPPGYTANQAAVNSVGGVNVKPETSFGYDLGASHRFSQFPDTVLTGDVYLTNLQNQFLKSVYQNGTVDLGGGTVPLFTTAYSNLSNARYEGVEGTLTHAPAEGWGWMVSGSLLRGYPYNIPNSIYQITNGVAVSNPGVVAGKNFGPTSLLSSGGSAIPYAGGYVEANFHSKEGWYGNIGMVYFGNNNTFNEPAFEIVRSTIRAPILGIKHTYFQFAVDNLFNTNSEIFDINAAGIAAPAVTNQFVPTNLKGYGPRDFHMELVHNLR